MSEIQMPTQHQFSVQDILLMEKAGVFAPGERVELLAGDLIDMSPILPPHAICVNNLNRFFIRNTAEETHIVSVQNPLWVDERTLLEPDLVIARNRKGLNSDEYIQPKDVALLIEVSDATYYFDRHRKLSVYAAAAIQECWIVNVQNRQIEVYSQPVQNEYAIINLHDGSFTTTFGFDVDPVTIFPEG